MKNKRTKSEPQLVGFIGVGFDNDDGEKRLTKSEHFVIVGGSEETHGRMQDTAIRFDEAIEREGRPLHEIPMADVLYILRDSQR